MNFNGKNRINLAAILNGALFVGLNGYALTLYGMDVSPLVLGLILFFYLKFLRKIDNLPSYFDITILATFAVLICIAAARFVIPDSFPIYSKGYAIPAVGLAILVTLLFDNIEFSLMFSLFVALLGAAISGGDYAVGMSLLCGSIIAVMLSFRVRRRPQVLQAGFFAGIVQFLVAFILAQGKQGVDITVLDRNLLIICLANAIGYSLAFYLFLSLFENSFKVITNLSLLELSDFNHPILRRLILEAPGTYQHSLVVANLSDAAAEAIGANSLLARVGAYYHDIGKIEKASYFVENQMSYRDAHKDLKPSMSKMIIMNHVKEGVDLAKHHRLNPRIIDFIIQHHGRTLVYYFYHLAKTLEPAQEHSEEEYRYPGPKPQTKEIAIVAMADVIEALSRTLDDPTPARLDEMVREIVKKRFMEGELDESDLTLKDLEKITQTFIRMLNASFHTRIDYPKENRG